MVQSWPPRAAHELAGYQAEALVCCIGIIFRYFLGGCENGLRDVTEHVNTPTASHPLPDPAGGGRIANFGSSGHCQVQSGITLQILRAFAVQAVSMRLVCCHFERALFLLFPLGTSRNSLSTSQETAAAGTDPQ